MASEPFALAVIGPGFQCSGQYDRRAIAMLAKQLLLYAEDEKVTGAVLTLAEGLELRITTEAKG